MIQLSVVIATRERTELLTRCLEAFVGQSQPAADFELVVVDDGSTPPIGTSLAQSMFPFRITVLPQESMGQAAALNRGAEAAHSPVCLFFDDDILAGRSLVAEHLAAQRNSGGAIAVGHLAYETGINTDQFAGAMVQWMRDHYARLEQSRTPLSFTDCYGGNLSVPRSAFLEVGGFSTRLKRGFDEELAYRLEKYGLEVHYLPRASGRHVLYKSAGALLRDSEEAGVAYVQMCEWHPGMLSKVPLGRFGEARPPEVGIRRILLCVGVPPRMLEAVARRVPGRKARMRLYSLIHRYAFWRGARKVMRDDLWKQLTNGAGSGRPRTRGR